MLEAKTEEQLEHVVSLLGEHPSVIEQYESGLVSRPFFIAFDTMAKIVDYLRKENEEVEIPTTCRVSANLDGAVYDLCNTQHEEVMQFCKRLAWVKGGSFDHYYEQYAKTGKIRL